MPVFEQGYRRYIGEKSTGSRAFAIAWENIRPRMRWWVWVLLFFLLFWPYLFHAVVVFIGSLGLGGAAALPAGQVSARVAFEGSSGPNPSVFLTMFQGNSLAFFWDLLDDSSFQSVIVTAIVGAGLLASDRRTGALQIYFARPVTRLDYLLGKAIAATFLVALTTALPSFILWIETVGFGSAANFSWRTWAAPFVIVGASVFYALWAVSLVLACSAIMRRPAFAAIAAIFIDLTLEGIGRILVESLKDKSWHVIQPSYAIGTMTAPICGMDLPPWMNIPAAFGVAVGIPALLLAFVWWRVRAVEVVT